MKKFVTLEVDGARQRGRPRKTWKEVVGKDMNDLQLKPRDVMDRRKMGGGTIRGNWSDSKTTDADIVCFWRRLTQVNPD